MGSISRNVASKDLRGGLADILGNVAYRSERVGVTRNGRLVAVIVSVDDFETLEELEAARDAEDLNTGEPLR